MLRPCRAVRRYCSGRIRPDARGYRRSASAVEPARSRAWRRGVIGGLIGQRGAERDRCARGPRPAGGSACESAAGDDGGDGVAARRTTFWLSGRTGWSFGIGVAATCTWRTSTPTSRAAMITAGRSMCVDAVECGPLPGGADPAVAVRASSRTRSWRVKFGPEVRSPMAGSECGTVRCTGGTTAEWLHLPTSAAVSLVPSNAPARDPQIGSDGLSSASPRRATMLATDQRDRSLSGSAGRRLN
jgi:hypothetical protein